MSKNQSKEQEFNAPEQEAPKSNLPTNPYDYGYVGDEKITMTAVEFMHLWTAIRTSMEKAISRRFISQPEWVSTITGEVMLQVSQEDVKKGLARQVTSIEKTFDPQGRTNFQETFEDWIYPNVIDGNKVIQEVHAKMIQEGVARPKEVIQKEMQEKQAAEQRALAEQQEAAQAPGPAPEMKVVKEESTPTAKRKRKSAAKKAVEKAPPAPPVDASAEKGDK